MGLFGRARNMIAGLAAPSRDAVQYYNVACPLGHRLRGQRAEGYQALRCPSCGEGVFVLPASPLPDPGPRVATPAVSRRAGVVGAPRAAAEGPIELTEADEVLVEAAEEAPAAAADVEIPWEEEAAEAPPRPRPRRRGRADAPADDRPEPRRGRPRPAVAEIEPRPRKRSGRNPVWIFAAVALVVAATVALRVWRNAVQNYPQVAELGRAEGIPALEMGEFDRAHQLLAPARQAVDALGGQVEDADRIRQAADEAALYVNLAPAGLEEMLDEAARASTPREWATRFNDRYKGRGVLFDTVIASTPDDASGRFEIDYVVLPTEDAGSFRADGARPERSARVDLRDFELFKLAGPETGDHVVFGARLAALEYDAEASGWVVRLEPESGLFVQFHKALDALGWPESEATPAPETEDEP